MQANMFTLCVLPLQKQLVFLCWSGRLQHSGLCLTLPSMPPVPLGWRPSLGCWVSHMTFTWYSYCNHVAVTWPSHDSTCTLYVSSTIYARFSCGDQQWKCWPGVWPEWGTQRSAGKWLELLHLIHKHIMDVIGTCLLIHLLLIFPSLLLSPSSTHSLPPTHTPHIPSLPHTLHTLPPSYTHCTLQGLALPTSRHLYPFTLEGSLFIAAAVSTTPGTVEQSIIKEQMNTDSSADFYPRYRQN